MVWSRDSHSEEPLTSPPSNTFPLIYDWSPDNKWLLVSQIGGGAREELWILPLASAPRAEAAAKKNCFRSRIRSLATTLLP